MYLMQTLSVHMTPETGLAQYRKQIPRVLRRFIAVPGIRHVTFIGDEDGYALTMLQLIWESADDADAWMKSDGYKQFLATVRPFLSEDVESAFIMLEGVGFNYPVYDFNADSDEVEPAQFFEEPLVPNADLEEKS